jgi:hypothetical protein
MVWCRFSLFNAKPMNPYDQQHKSLRIKRQFVTIWTIMVGLMDILMGLLWMIDSAVFLKVAGGVMLSHGAWEVLGGIGIGIGLVYAFALRGANGKRAAEVWIATAVLHGLAGIVVIWLVVSGFLPALWWGVALLGLIVAVVQLFTVRAKWWTTVHKPRFMDSHWMLFESSKGIPSRDRW